MILSKFRESLESYKKYLSYIEKLSSLGVDLLESQIGLTVDTLLDTVIDSNCTSEEASDLIYWWLFEDVDKIITEGEKDINVEDIDDLLSYMDKNGYLKN